MPLQRARVVTHTRPHAPCLYTKREECVRVCIYYYSGCHSHVSTTKVLTMYPVVRIITIIIISYNIYYGITTYRIDVFA